VDLLEKSKYHELVHVRHKQYKLNCNWKVFIDNYLDGGYHVPIAHPALASSLNMNSYATQSFENFFLQTCDPKIKSNEFNNDINTNDKDYETNKVESTLNNTQDNNNALLIHTAVKNCRLHSFEHKNNTETSYNDNKALYIFQYPNICINRYGQWMDTNIVWPVNEKECIVNFDWYVDKSLLLPSQVQPSSNQIDINNNNSYNNNNNSYNNNNINSYNEKYIQECIQQSEIVQNEDIALCERVQKGLNSGAYDSGVYAPMVEQGEFMFHKKLYSDLLEAELLN
jgi:choline monooxygenase